MAKPPLIWYRVAPYSPIEEVAVERFTEKTYRTPCGRVNHRVTSYDSVHPTVREAVQASLEGVEKKMKKDREDRARLDAQIEEGLQKAASLIAALKAGEVDVVPLMGARRKGRKIKV